VTFAYTRARFVTSVLANDLLLASVLIALALLRPSGKLALALALAAPFVLAWGYLTLHFPSKVEIDDEGVAFFAYGRAHRYRWREVTRVHVRRFLVRDRVLVRILPGAPFRGRYWLLDSMQGYDALVATLEARTARAV
jgi:hypothetical protein